MTSKIRIRKNSKIPYHFSALNLTMLLVLLLPRALNVRYIIIFLLVIISLLICGVKAKYLKMNVGMFIYAVTFIFSEIIHFYSGSLKDIFIFLTMFIILRYLIFIGLSDRAHFMQFLENISIVALIYGVLAIIEAFTEFNLFDLIFNRSFELSGANSYRYGIYRGHGACTISINNGMLIAFLLCITGYLLLNHLSKKRKVLILTYIVLLVAIGLNLSRMIWIVVIVTQCVLAVKCGMGWVIKRILIVCVVLIIALPLLGQFIDVIRTFLQNMFLALVDTSYMDRSTGIGSAGERLQLWSIVFDEVKNSLLFGVGFTEDFSVNIINAYGNAMTKTSIEVHWLYVLYRKGLFGMIGFIAYQVSCLMYCWRKRKKRFNERFFSFNFLIIIVSIGYFVAIFSFSGFEDLYFYYIMFSICEAYNEIIKKERTLASSLHSNVKETV